MAGLVHLCALFIWTTVAVQSIGWTPRYPELGKPESLQCSCPEGQCQPAFWCRIRSDQFQFLLSHNTADRSTYASDSDKSLYTGTVQVGSTTPTYFLKILKVTKEDAGLYFCFLMSKGALILGSAVMDLRPGETPPTLAPITTTTKAKAKAPPSCSCRDQGKTKPVKGCSLAVFWSLVGTLVTLALVLLGTLMYFSRLPRKCRHRIAKR